MFTKKFLIDSAERIIVTMAQVAAAGIGVGQIPAFDIDWRYVGGVTLTAGILSALKCLYARNAGDPEKASLVQ